MRGIPRRYVKAMPKRRGGNQAVGYGNALAPLLPAGRKLSPDFCGILIERQNAILEFARKADQSGAKRAFPAPRLTWQQVGYVG